MIIPTSTRTAAAMMRVECQIIHKTAIERPRDKPDHFSSRERFCIPAVGGILRKLNQPTLEFAKMHSNSFIQHEQPQAPLR